MRVKEKRKKVSKKESRREQEKEREGLDHTWVFAMRSLLAYAFTAFSLLLLLS